MPSRRPQDAAQTPLVCLRAWRTATTTTTTTTTTPSPATAKARGAQPTPPKAQIPSWAVAVATTTTNFTPRASLVPAATASHRCAGPPATPARLCGRLPAVAQRQRQVPRRQVSWIRTASTTGRSSPKRRSSASMKLS